jgi:hypothetical protein
VTRPRAIISQIPVTELKTQAEAVAFSIAWPGREVEPAAGYAVIQQLTVAYRPGGEHVAVE